MKASHIKKILKFYIRHSLNNDHRKNIESVFLSQTKELINLTTIAYDRRRFKSEKKNWIFWKKQYVLYYFVDFIIEVSNHIRG